MSRQILLIILLFPLIVLLFTACKKYGAGPQPVPGSTVVVTTVAGTGEAGDLNGSVSAATFNAPVDIYAGSNGELYVLDLKSHRIRKIVAGQVSDFAGTGVYGVLDGPGPQAAFK